MKTKKQEKKPNEQPAKLRDLPTKRNPKGGVGGGIGTVGPHPIGPGPGG